MNPISPRIAKRLNLLGLTRDVIGLAVLDLSLLVRFAIYPSPSSVASASGFAVTGGWWHPNATILLTSPKWWPRALGRPFCRSRHNGWGHPIMPPDGRVQSNRRIIGQGSSGTICCGRGVPGTYMRYPARPAVKWASNRRLAGTNRVANSSYILGCHFASLLSSTSVPATCSIILSNSASTLALKSASIWYTSQNSAKAQRP